jgi:hypothetical protein
MFLNEVLGTEKRDVSITHCFGSARAKHREKQPVFSLNMQVSGREEAAQFTATCPNRDE